MESALRVFLIIAAVALSLWVAKYLHENPVEGEVSRLQAEVERLSAANVRLQEENERARMLVRGLREDRRVLDRRAREMLGMVRESELIIFFPEDPSDGDARP